MKTTIRTNTHLCFRRELGSLVPSLYRILVKPPVASDLLARDSPILGELAE